MSLAGHTCAYGRVPAWWLLQSRLGLFYVLWVGVAWGAACVCMLALCVRG